MLGGYFLSMISIFAFLNYIEFIYDDINYFLFKILIFVVIISTVSQIGDIIISFFKRKSKIKDTGKIIIGQGLLIN